jgi:hypothetical protein
MHVQVVDGENAATWGEMMECDGRFDTNGISKDFGSPLVSNVNLVIKAKPSKFEMLSFTICERTKKKKKKKKKITKKLSTSQNARLFPYARTTIAFEHAIHNSTPTSTPTRPAIIVDSSRPTSNSNLMGIRNFYKTIPPLFPKCRLQFGLPGGSYDHIALDFNNLLYNGNTLTHADFVRHCARQASKPIARQLHATRSLYFALDGAAPAAKLVLQRARRLDDADSLRRDLLFYGVRESSASSIELTPGTELMLSVADALAYAACSHLVRASTRLRAPQVAVFVDGSGVAGEGESKIFAHIRAHGRAHDRTLIVSGDSDVLLCGLMSSRRRIDILSTNTAAATAPAGYSVDALRREIALFFRCGGADDHDDSATLARVLDDFCLFALLLGSDFTPALQHYQFHDTLLAYRRMRESAPQRFVYDRAADSIDVDALLQCLVTKAAMPTHDDSKRWALFAERFGALVPDSATLPPNAESFLYGIQWSLRYLGDDGADDRYFCKQFRPQLRYEDIVAWAAADEHASHTMCQSSDTSSTAIAAARRPRRCIAAVSAALCRDSCRWRCAQLHRDCVGMNSTWRSAATHASCLASMCRTSTPRCSTRSMRTRRRAWQPRTLQLPSGA